MMEDKSMRKFLFYSGHDSTRKKSKVDVLL